MPTAGTRGTGGQITRDAAKVCFPSYRGSLGERESDPVWVNLMSNLRHPRETGYTANQRPVICYRPSLDHIDNPQFGLLLSNNFLTLTQLHYKPQLRADCSGSLPNLINKPRDSGFHQLRRHQQPEAGGEEKTEYQRWFVPHRVTRTVSQQPVTIGPRGETGFTEGTDLQLITFREKNSRRAEPQQPRGSVMKHDFLLPSSRQGAELIPSLCSRSCRETGFTRGTSAPSACPTSLPPQPQSDSNGPTVKRIGRKEPTGSLLNSSNQVFPNTPFDRSHFTTHYRSKFCRDADAEKLSSGPCGAGIIRSALDNSFSRRDVDNT